MVFRGYNLAQYVEAGNLNCNSDDACRPLVPPQHDFNKQRSNKFIILTVIKCDYTTSASASTMGRLVIAHHKSYHPYLCIDESSTHVTEYQIYSFDSQAAKKQLGMDILGCFVGELKQIRIEVSRSRIKCYSGDRTDDSASSPCHI
jgi:hypothetical protein